MRADLLARGAMNAGVGHGFLPVSQMHILGAQTYKLLAGQPVGLNVFDPGLDLTFVARHRRFRRQDHGAIMFAERNHFGIEFGLEPVDLLAGRPQVVDDQRPDHPAKVPEGIFQPADEVLGSLPPEGLGVPLA